MQYNANPVGSNKYFLHRGNRHFAALDFEVNRCKSAGGRYGRPLTSLACSNLYLGGAWRDRKIDTKKHGLGRCALRRIRLVSRAGGG